MNMNMNINMNIKNEYKKIYEKFDCKLDNKGYLKYFENKWKFVHTEINKYFNGEPPTEFPNNNINNNHNWVTHHKDFDKTNNHPDNLEWMGERDHIIYHSKNIQNLHEKIWNNPEFRKMMKDVQSKTGTKNLLKKWQDTKYREKMTKKCSDTVTKLWENTEYREIMKQISSNNINKLWLNLDFRENVSKAATKNITKLNNDPEFKEMMFNVRSKTGTKNLTKKWQDIEFRKKVTIQASEIGKKTGKKNITNYNNNKSFYLLKNVIDNNLELTEENYKKINGSGSGITSFKTAMIFIENNTELKNKIFL